MADTDTLPDDDENGGGTGKKIKRRFRSEDGTLTPRSVLDVTAVIFQFPNGHEMVMELQDLFPDSGLPPPSVGRAAIGAGINTSVGNVFGGIKDIDEAIEAAETRWGTLQDGAWTADRKTGPRTSDLVEAWARFREKNGAPHDEAWRAKAKQLIISGVKSSKELLSMASLRAEYDAIKAKRAAERAEKSRAAAQGATPESFGDLLSEALPGRLWRPATTEPNR